MTNRRAFLIQLAAGAGIAGAGIAPLLASNQAQNRPGGRHSLRFAVASDGHFGEAGTDFERFHRDITDWLNFEARSAGLDFVVFNGDLIHNDPAFLPQLKAHYDRLEVPYFVNRGNHDQASPELWKQTWGCADNYAFDRGDYGFLLLSTSNQQGDYVCADATWLRKQLEAWKAKKGIFAFLHIGQVKFTRHAIACPEVTALLEQTPNLLAVFHGHDHDIDNVIYSNGRAYFFDGHFGGSWGTNYRGYRIVEIFPDGQVITQQCNPQAFRVNATRLG